MPRVAHTLPQNNVIIICIIKNDYKIKVPEIFDQWVNVLHNVYSIPEVNSERSAVESSARAFGIFLIQTDVLVLTENCLETSTKESLVEEMQDVKSNETEAHLITHFEKP